MFFSVDQKINPLDQLWICNAAKRRCIRNITPDTASYYYSFFILPENDILFLYRIFLLLSGMAVRNVYR